MSTSNSRSSPRAGAIGTPRYTTEKKTLSFVIHDFENLPDKERGHLSSPLECHGYEWKLLVYPFGGNEEAKEQGKISVFLHCCDSSENKKVLANYVFWLDGATTGCQSGGFECFDGRGLGLWNLTLRSNALSMLDSNGDLTIHVQLQVKKETVEQWRPPTLQNSLIQLYDDGRLVDVSFALGEYVVRAHKFVLSLRAPTLYEMAVDASHENSDDEVTKVDLSADNTAADLFAMMIRFLYADTLPEYFELDKDGLDLLKMADQFGCSDLKMYVEAELVESKHVTPANAAEILLLADSHSCALLKETAMDIVATNLPAITPTKGWKNLKQSADLLAEVCEYQTNRSVGANVATNNPQQETVSGMRKRLAELGQDVDGTKETLAKRLKSNE